MQNPHTLSHDGRDYVNARIGGVPGSVPIRYPQAQGNRQELVREPFDDGRAGWTDGAPVGRVDCATRPPRTGSRDRRARQLVRDMKTCREALAPARPRRGKKGKA